MLIFSSFASYHCLWLLLLVVVMRCVELVDATSTPFTRQVVMQYRLLSMTLVPRLSVTTIVFISTFYNSLILYLHRMRWTNRKMVQTAKRKVHLRNANLLLPSRFALIQKINVYLIIFLMSLKLNMTVKLLRGNSLYIGKLQIKSFFELIWKKVIHLVDTHVI